MESFWGSLKNELIHQKPYLTRQTAIDEIVEYVEAIYAETGRACLKWQCPFYSTGVTPTFVIAIGAMFSALEVVPLAMIDFEAYRNY